MTNTTMVFVWSRNIRVFHWLNVMCILILVAIGVVILNAKFLGISADGKIALKTLHVIVGYVFAVNLLFRLFIALVGKGYEKFGAFLPFMPGFVGELKTFKRDEKHNYKGHNPAGKLMVGLLLLIMTSQMVTGLLLAGTDIYYPPLGQHFATSIAVDKTQVDTIKPYSKENVDEKAYQAMRDLRAPFISLHIFCFYTLTLLIPLHIIGVVVAERKDKSGLISSMVSGYKSLPKE